MFFPRDALTFCTNNSAVTVILFSLEYIFQRLGQWHVANLIIIVAGVLTVGRKSSQKKRTSLEVIGFIGFDRLKTISCEVIRPSGFRNLYFG